jgi:hypothetical protein
MKLVMAAAVTALAGISSAAYAESATIHINGYVPVICHAEFAAMPAQHNDLIRIGTIKEFCNDGRGYQLIASYSAGDGLGEFILDGQSVTLDPSGSTVLARQSGPRSVVQTLIYRPGTSSVKSLSIEVRAASM